jgi:hypothetical protein
MCTRLYVYSIDLDPVSMCTRLYVYSIDLDPRLYVYSCFLVSDQLFAFFTWLKGLFPLV